MSGKNAVTGYRKERRKSTDDLGVSNQAVG